MTHLLSLQYPVYFMGFNFYLDHICVLMPFGCDYAKVVEGEAACSQVIV